MKGVVSAPMKSLVKCLMAEFPLIIVFFSFRSPNLSCSIFTEWINQVTFDLFLFPQRASRIFFLQVLVLWRLWIHVSSISIYALLPQTIFVTCAMYWQVKYWNYSVTIVKVGLCVMYFLSKTVANTSTGLQRTRVIPYSMFYLLILVHLWIH